MIFQFQAATKSAHMSSKEALERRRRSFVFVCAKWKLNLALWSTPKLNLELNLFLEDLQGVSLAKLS